MKKVVHIYLSCFLLLFAISIACAQEKDSTENIKNFSGKIFLSHNGISLIPTFSIEKPAAIMNLRLGGQRFAFEPDIRFSLAGQPWSMFFWFRYKLLNKGKFKFRLGAATPGFNFRTIDAVANGKNKEVIEARRFISGELTPVYEVSKNFRIGMYYIYGRGFDDSQRNTHLAVFNTMFPNIKLDEKLSLGVFPNVYYLRLDNLDGYYFASTVRLFKKDFPFSIECLVNKIIDSRILPEKDFVWSLSLVYSFDKKFVGFNPKI